jgi:TetR/AcrR family transcriptional regulator, transcriptional repressor for nem operon
VRYDAEHKQQTRRKVLGEAAAAIRKLGPDGIGVADLMARVGLTHGGFYAHFRSKDELIAEAIATMFDDRYAVLLSCLEGEEPAEGLAAFVDGYLSARHRAAVQSGCPLASLAGDVARLPPAARQRFTAGTRRLTNAMAQALGALGMPEPRQLAASMLAEMVGALAISRAIADPELAARILKASRDSLKRRLTS